MEPAGPQQPDNASYEGLPVSSADLEILAYLAVNHHMARLEAASSKMVIRRE